MGINEEHNIASILLQIDLALHYGEDEEVSPFEILMDIHCAYQWSRQFRCMASYCKLSDGFLLTVFQRVIKSFTVIKTTSWH